MSLVSAPRVFQAVCKDKLFPYTSYFAAGYGPSNEPRRGYFLAYFVALVFVLLGTFFPKSERRARSVS